jgi:SAM-dependent methyltransferase
MAKKQKALISAGSLWGVVRKVIYPLLRRLPRSLKERLNFLRAILRGDFRIVQASHNIPKNFFEIELSDDLRMARIRCEHDGWILEREQSPTVSLFGDSGAFIRSGVSAPDAYEIRFRGVKLSWLTKSGVWPPTLDSYILTSTLVDSWPHSDSRVWEVGCGTGIIGLHLLRLTSCQEALMNDMDPRAIEHTRVNARQMGVSNFSLRVETFPPKIRPSITYDLLVSNPPYFPPGFFKSKVFEYKAYDDLLLTKAILDVGLLYAKKVVFGFSSVMREEIMSRLLELGQLGIKWRILSTTRLPLSMGGLQENCKFTAGVFTEGPNAQFDLWHDFSVCELQHTETQHQHSKTKDAILPEAN